MQVDTNRIHLPCSQILLWRPHRALLCLLAFPFSFPRSSAIDQSSSQGCRFTMSWLTPWTREEEGLVGAVIVMIDALGRVGAGSLSRLVYADNRWVSSSDEATMSPTFPPRTRELLTHDRRDSNGVFFLFSQVVSLRFPWNLIPMLGDMFSTIIPTVIAIRLSRCVENRIQMPGFDSIVG